MPSSVVNRAIAAAIAASAAPLAHASSVVLTDDINISQLLGSSGSSYSGAFSITSLLQQAGLSAAQISDATITAYGFSDATVNQTSTSYTSAVTVTSSQYVISGYYEYSYTYEYSYSCGWNDTCYAYATGYAYAPYYALSENRNVVNTTTTTNTDTVQDTMTVKAGTVTASGSVSNQPPTTVVGPVNFAGYATNGYYDGLDTVYTQANTVTQGYYGALQASGALGPAELYQLGANGTLAFTITDTVGSMELGDAVLTFTATPVPLPAAGGLLASGLAALAMAARRRRRPGDT